MNKINKKRKLNSKTKIKITLATLMGGLMVGGLTPIILDLEAKNEEQRFLSKPSSITTNLATPGFPSLAGQTYTTASTNDPSVLATTNPLVFTSEKKTLVKEIRKKIPQTQITLEEALAGKYITFDNTPFYIGDTVYTIKRIQLLDRYVFAGFRFEVDLTIGVGDLETDASISVYSTPSEHQTLRADWENAYFQIVDDLDSVYRGESLATEDPMYVIDKTKSQVRVTANDQSLSTIFIRWLQNPTWKWYEQTFTDPSDSSVTTTTELAETIPTDTTDTKYVEIVKTGYTSYGEFLKDKSKYLEKVNTKYDIKSLTTDEWLKSNFPDTAEESQGASRVEFTKDNTISPTESFELKNGIITTKGLQPNDIEKNLNTISDLQIYIDPSSFSQDNYIEIEDRVDLLLKGKMQWHDGTIYNIRWTTNQKVRDLKKDRPISVSFDDIKVYNSTTGVEIVKSTLKKQELEADGTVTFKPILFNTNLYFGKNIGDDDNTNDLWKLISPAQTQREFQDPTLSTQTLTIAGTTNSDYIFKWSDVFSENPKNAASNFRTKTINDPAQTNKGLKEIGTEYGSKSDLDWTSKDIIFDPTSSTKTHFTTKVKTKNTKDADTSIFIDSHLLDYYMIFLTLKNTTTQTTKEIIALPHPSKPIVNLTFQTPETTQLKDGSYVSTEYDQKTIIDGDSLKEYFKNPSPNKEWIKVVIPKFSYVETTTGRQYRYTCSLGSCNIGSRTNLPSFKFSNTKVIPETIIYKYLDKTQTLKPTIRLKGYSTTNDDDDNIRIHSTETKTILSVKETRSTPPITLNLNYKTAQNSKLPNGQTVEDYLTTQPINANSIYANLKTRYEIQNMIKDGNSLNNNYWTETQKQHFQKVLDLRILEFYNFTNSQKKTIEKYGFLVEDNTFKIDLSQNISLTPSNQERTGQGIYKNTQEIIKEDLQTIDDLKINFFNQNLAKYGLQLDERIDLLLKGKMQWHDGKTYDIRWTKNRPFKEWGEKTSEVIPFDDLEIYDSTGLKIDNSDLKKQTLDDKGDVELKPIIFNANLYFGKNIGDGDTSNDQWTIVDQSDFNDYQDFNIPGSDTTIKAFESTDYRFKWNDVYSELPNVKTGYVISDNDKPSEQALDVSSFLADHPYSKGFSYIKRNNIAIHYKDGDVLRNAYGVPMIFQVTGEAGSTKNVISNLSTIKITAEELQILRSILSGNLTRVDESTGSFVNVPEPTSTAEYITKKGLLTSTSGTSKTNEGIISKFTDKGHEFEGLYAFRWYDLSLSNSDYLTEIQKKFIDSPIFKKLFYQKSNIKKLTDEEHLKTTFTFESGTDIKDYEYDTEGVRLVKRRYDFDLNRGYPTLTENSYNQRNVEEFDPQGYFEYVRQDFRIDPVDGIIKVNEVFITLKDLHLTINPHGIIVNEAKEQELDTSDENVKFSLDKVVNPLNGAAAARGTYCDGEEYWNSRTSSGSANQEKAFGITKGLTLDELDKQPLALSTSESYPSYLPCSNFETGQTTASLLETNLETQTKKISEKLYDSSDKTGQSATVGIIRTEDLKNEVLTNTPIYQKSTVEITIKNPEYTRIENDGEIILPTNWDIVPNKSTFDKFYTTTGSYFGGSNGFPYEDYYFHCQVFDLFAWSWYDSNRWNRYSDKCLSRGTISRKGPMVLKYRHHLYKRFRTAIYKSTLTNNIDGMSINGEFYRKQATINDDKWVTEDLKNEWEKGGDDRAEKLHVNNNKKFIKKGIMNLNTRTAINEFNKKLSISGRYTNRIPYSYIPQLVSSVSSLEVGNNISLSFKFQDPTTPSNFEVRNSVYTITNVNLDTKTIDVKSSKGGYERTIKNIKWYLPSNTNGRITENVNLSNDELLSRLNVKTTTGGELIQYLSKSSTTNQKKIIRQKDNNNYKSYGYFEISKKETTPINQGSSLTESKYTVDIYTPKSITIKKGVTLDVELTNTEVSYLEEDLKADGSSNNRNKKTTSKIELIKTEFQNEKLPEVKPLEKNLNSVRITTPEIQTLPTTIALVKSSAGSLVPAKPISIQKIDQKLDFKVDVPNSYGEDPETIKVEDNWRGYSKIRLTLPNDKAFKYNFNNIKDIKDEDYENKDVNFKLVTIKSKDKTGTEADNKKVKMISSSFKPEDIQQKVVFAYSKGRFNKINLFKDTASSNYYENVRLNEFVMDEYGMWLVGIKTKTGKVFWELYYLTNEEFEADVKNPTNKKTVGSGKSKLNWKSRAAFSFGIENFFTQNSFILYKNYNTNPTNFGETNVASDENYYWNAGDGISSKNNEGENNFDEDLYLTTPTFTNDDSSLPTGKNVLRVDPQHPSLLKAEYKIISESGGIITPRLTGKEISQNKLETWRYRTGSDFSKDGLTYSENALKTADTIANFEETDIKFSIPPAQVKPTAENGYTLFLPAGGQTFELRKNTKGTIKIKLTYNIFDKEGNPLVVTKTIHWNDPQSFIKTKLVDETKKTQGYIDIQKETLTRLNTLTEPNPDGSTSNIQITTTNKITALEEKIRKIDAGELASDEEKPTIFEYNVLVEELKYLKQIISEANKLEIIENSQDNPKTNVDFFALALDEIKAIVADNSVQNVVETYVHWNNLSTVPTPTEEKGSDEYNQKLQTEVNHVNNLRKATIEKDKNQKIKKDLLNGFSEEKVKILYDALQLFINSDWDSLSDDNYLTMTKPALDTLQNTITTNELVSLARYLKTKTVAYLQRFIYPAPTKEQKEADTYEENYNILTPVQKLDFLRKGVFNAKLLFNEVKKIYFQINQGEQDADKTYFNKALYVNNKFVGSESEQIVKLNLTTYENVVQVMLDKQKITNPTVVKTDIESPELLTKVNQLDGSFEKAYVINNDARKEKILDLINVKTIAHYNQIKNQKSSYSLGDNFPVIKIYKSSIYTTTWKEYAILTAGAIRGDSRSQIKEWLNNLNIFDPTLLNQGKYMIVFLPANNRNAENPSNFNPNMLISEYNFPYLNIVNLGGQSNKVFTEDLIVSETLTINDAFSNANSRRLSVKKTDDENEGSYRTSYQKLKLSDTERPYFYSSLGGEPRAFESVFIADEDSSTKITQTPVNRVNGDHTIGDLFKTTDEDKITANDFYSNSIESTKRIYRVFTEDLTENNIEDLTLQTNKALDNGTQVITNITLRKLFQPLEVLNNKEALSYYTLDAKYFETSIQRERYLELVSKYSEEFDTIIANDRLKQILENEPSPFETGNLANKETYSKMKALIKMNQERYINISNTKFTSFGKYTINYTSFKNFNNPASIDQTTIVNPIPTIGVGAIIEKVSVVRILEESNNNDDASGDRYPYFGSKAEKPVKPFYLGKLSPIGELKRVLTEKLKTNTNLVDTTTGDLKPLFKNAIEKSFSSSNVDSLSKYSNNIDDDYINATASKAVFYCSFVFTAQECAWYLEDVNKGEKNKKVSVSNILSEEQIQQLLDTKTALGQNEILNSEGFLYRNENAVTLSLEYIKSRTPEYLVKKLSIAERLWNYYKTTDDIKNLKLTDQALITAIKTARKNSKITNLNQTLAYRINLLKTPLTKQETDFIWDETTNPTTGTIENRLTNLNNELLLNYNINDLRSWGVKIKIGNTLYYIEQEESVKNVKNVEKGNVLFDEETPLFSTGVVRSGFGLNQYVNNFGEITTAKKLDITIMMDYLKAQYDNNPLNNDKVVTDQAILRKQLLKDFLSTLGENNQSLLVDADYLTSSKYRSSVEIDVHNPDPITNDNPTQSVEVNAIKRRANNLNTDVLNTFFRLDQEANVNSKVYYRKVTSDTGVISYILDGDKGRYIQDSKSDDGYKLDTSRNYILDNFKDFVKFPTLTETPATSRDFITLLKTLRDEQGSGLEYKLYYSNVYDSSFKPYRVRRENEDGSGRWVLLLKDNEIMDFLRRNSNLPQKLHIVVSLNKVEKFRFNVLTYLNLRGSSGIQDIDNNPYFKGSYNFESERSTKFDHDSGNRNNKEAGEIDSKYTFKKANKPTSVGLKGDEEQENYFYYQDANYLKNARTKNLANLVNWRVEGLDLQTREGNNLKQNEYYIISRTNSKSIARALDAKKTSKILEIKTVTLKAFPSEYTVDISKNNWYYRIKLVLKTDNTGKKYYEIESFELNDNLINEELKKQILDKKIEIESRTESNGAEYFMRNLIDTLSNNNLYLNFEYETTYNDLAKEITGNQNLPERETSTYNIITPRKKTTLTLTPISKDVDGNPIAFTKTESNTIDTKKQKFGLGVNRLTDLQTLTRSDLKTPLTPPNNNLPTETDKFKITTLTKTNFEETNAYHNFFKFQDTANPDITFLISPKFFDSETNEWLLDKDIFNSEMYKVDLSKSKEEQTPYVLIEPANLKFTSDKDTVVDNPKEPPKTDNPDTITPTTPTDNSFIPGLSDTEGIIVVAASILALFALIGGAYIVSRRRKKGLKVTGSSLDDKF